MSSPFAPSTTSCAAPASATMAAPGDSPGRSVDTSSPDQHPARSDTASSRTDCPACSAHSKRPGGKSGKSAS